MADSDLTPLHWLQNIDIMSGCGIDDTLKDNVVIDLTDYKTTNKKPNLSYSSLIVRAIKSTPCKKMTLSQIYAWIKENYIYYAKARPAWQNSIRHNLSLNRCFTKIPRSKDDPGKGGFWGFDETQSGQTNKRRKKKKKKPKENSKNENTDQTVIIDNSQNIIPTSPISASEPTYIIQLTNEDDSGQLMGTSVSTITATDLAGTIDPTTVSLIFEPTQQLIHEHQQLEQHQLQLDLAQGQQEQMSQTIILAASAPTIEVDDGQDLELGYETSVEDTSTFAVENKDIEGQNEIIENELILENVYWESVLDLDHLISIGEL